MKRKLLCSAALLLALLVLAGCTAAPQSSQTDYTPPAPSSSAVETPEETKEKGVSLLVPTGNTALAALLQGLAAAEGITLTMDTLPGGVGYAQQAGQAMAAGDYDLVLLQDAAEFEAADGTAWCADLLDSTAPGTRALAAMVQKNVRIEDKSRVYGLPLGYNALGYIVDLELLAALLDTQNLAALREDLTLCSWRQWRLLCISIEQYLAKPGRIQITLAGTTYYTPRYRPEEATRLRGIFAVPDDDAQALMQGAFTAALAAPYEDWRAFAQADEAQKSALAYPTLGALMGLLEFETLHMTRAEGVLYRGEAYTSWGKLGAQAAEALFCDGTALFYRADMTTARRLEAGQPTLAGRLCLVPVKLPIPAAKPQQDEAEDAVETSDTQADSSAAQADDGDTETKPTEEVDVRLAIAQQNQRLWYYSTGTLCMARRADTNEMAHLLLLRLFGGEEGLQGLRALGTQPYATLAGAADPLGGQLYEALDGPGGALLPRYPAADQSAQAALGAWVQENLLYADEWGEQEIDGFLTAGFVALGLRVEHIPELEQADPLEFDEDEAVVEAA